ncbi:MAG: hypothetical protein ACRCYO_09550, partial [Bacteroidia bacterium]
MKTMSLLKSATLLVLLLLFYGSGQVSAQSQNACNAINLGSQDTCRTNEIIQQSEQWYVFTADSSLLRFQISNVLAHDSVVNAIEFYSGSCNALQLLPYTPTLGGSIEGRIDSLTIGQMYFIRLQIGSANYAQVHWCIKFGNPSPQSGTCQNPNFGCDLICNGNFEYYSNGFYQADIWVANPWNALTGTSDYYNVNGYLHTDQAVPHNAQGTQTALSGNGYAGFHTYAYWVNNNREYVLQPMQAPLVVGQRYDVSFWVSRADSSSHATKNIGAYFSLTQPTQNANLTNLNVVPQIVDPNFIFTTSSWQQVKGTLVGNGEQYITIGQFQPDAGSHQFISSTAYPWGDMAYY